METLKIYTITNGAIWHGAKVILKYGQPYIELGSFGSPSPQKGVLPVYLSPDALKKIRESGAIKINSAAWGEKNGLKWLEQTEGRLPLSKTHCIIIVECILKQSKRVDIVVPSGEISVAYVLGQGKMVAEEVGQENTIDTMKMVIVARKDDLFQHLLHFEGAEQVKGSIFGFDGDGVKLYSPKLEDFSW